MKKKDILIIVDYQKDFVDGALGFDKATTLDDGIADLAKQYIEAENGIVICTYDTHFDHYLETQEGSKLPVPHCIRGSEGWKLYGKTGAYIYNLFEGLRPLDDGMMGDCVIETDTSEALGVTDKLYLVEKPAFPSLTLGNFLRSLDKQSGIRKITFVALVTNMCVISNAVVAKAACPEAEIVIKKDLVASFDEDLHAKTLEVAAAMQMTIE
ncbi:MAG: cysteine hydrolase [Lachnospiraceae bacterium]|nr:cysteine hydrolase [Lachnospiraceae bacterium]